MANETDYFALFGLPKPEEDPKQETEQDQDTTQEPVKEPTLETENEQEQDLQQEPAAQDAKSEPKGPTAEELEAQRQQELEDARREAREQARADMQREQEERERAFFRKAQLKNQYDPEHPVISSMEEFNAWWDQHQTKRMEQQLKSGQLTPEMLDQAAKRAMDARMAAVPAQEVPTAEQVQQEQKAKFQQQVERELTEIQKLDPSMTSIKAVLDSPMGDDFREAVKDGANFLTAFKTAKRLAGFRATAKKAEVRANDLGSKKHLQTHRGSGMASQEKEVPADTVAMYRMLNPNMTDEEIRKDYNKRMK